MGDNFEKQVADLGFRIIENFVSGGKYYFEAEDSFGNSHCVANFTKYTSRNDFLLNVLACLKRVVNER